ncbi:Putative porin [Flavobacterium sp. CF108]|uniref:putative porin n=1 Tax=unclassified Flavobacterium TaxID=196869 RepID=UPI0008AAC256|nr:MULTISPECIES: putative porin [unclassified Flavobacterium]SEP21915.1 Putative porin [Flavobacterium sp. fv08]SHI08326.1 Putative porin [Flavobacterium sp. CF108]
MRIFIFLYLLIVPALLFSQEKPKPASKNNLDMNTQYSSITDTVKKKKAKIATIDQYQIITLEHDTIYADTSLTIKGAYKQNHLRKDLFGLLESSNIGQPLNTLQYSLTSFSPYPEIGFSAMHSNYIQADEVRYYSAATPFTELFFNTTINKGQNVDSFITLNVSKNLNFSIAYRGLRSEGDYINQLVSAGNFRFTTSYATTNRRYALNAHYTYQDNSNEENGGITTPEDFESDDPDFKNRQRLQVYLTDAKSFLKGRRLFFDHAFRINPTHGNNNLYVNHQLNYENKFFEYNQPTVLSAVDGIEDPVKRFGESYVTSNINDQTHFERLYNKVGLAYENSLLGKFNFFVDDYRSNYQYDKIIVFKDGRIIQDNLFLQINNVGGQYEYQKNKWNGRFLYTRSITNQSLSDLDAKLRYTLNDKIQFDFRYRNINKLPNNNYNLYQSSYVSYNWSKDFKNEKINTLGANIYTPWLNAEVNYTVLNDHLYFDDVSDADDDAVRTQIISPAQYGNAINYLEIKANREFKFGNFALDNTLLYQKVDQSDLILNVPDFVTRNTLYYSNYYFKKALYAQAGVVFNYFTKYYANDYNPVIGEFFVQDKKEIGNYATFDVFINARIRQTRFYIKGEHLNALFSSSNYYSTPNNPYRDFVIRFGLVWNFFQ